MRKIIILLTIISIMIVLSAKAEAVTVLETGDNAPANWVVDRFAGNSGAGMQTYGGPAREAGGLWGLSSWVVGTPDGTTYLLYSQDYPPKHPDIVMVTPDGKLRPYMEHDGKYAGAREECMAGLPVWNSHDQSLYITGPNCLRHIVTQTDGTQTVEVVAGTCGTSGTADGAALSATFKEAQPLGVVCDSQGNFYWMSSDSSDATSMSNCLRKIAANGTVSTVPLEYADSNEYTVNGGNIFHFGYDKGTLTLGPDDNTLYINNYTGGYKGIFKIDLTSGDVTRVAVIPSFDDPNNLSGTETDGLALTEAGIVGGVIPVYDAFYDTLWVSGPDSMRIRWMKDSSGTVKTIFDDGYFDVTVANSTGVSGSDWSMYQGWNVGSDSDGGVFLRDWRDERGLWRAYNPTSGGSALSGTTSVPVGNSKIYAALVGTNGSIVKNSFQIDSTSIGGQEFPRVAYFDGTYLVVWQDSRNGINGNIYGIRLNSSGTVLDSSPILITNEVRTQAVPDVDADSQGFVVVWQGFSGTSKFPRIYARRVNSDGTMGSVVTPNLDTNYVSSNVSHTPRIAWNGTEHLLAYSGMGNGGGDGLAWTVSWARFNTSLQVQGSPQSIYWTESSLAVSSTSDPADGWTILQHGSAPDPWFHTQASMKAIGITSSGALAPDYPSQNTNGGTTIPANWLDAQTNSNGLAPYGAMAITKDATYNIAAWTQYSFSDIYSSDPDIHVGRVDGWQVIDAVGGVAAAETNSEEWRPALAGNGSGTVLLTYEKRGSGVTGIMAKMLTVAGTITVGNEFTVGATNGPGGSRRSYPASTYGNSNFLVVWSEGYPYTGNNTEFEDKCAQDGVLVCEGFDEQAHIDFQDDGHYWSGFFWNQGVAISPATDSGPGMGTLDASVKASGYGSLRFNVPESRANEGTGNAGQFRKWMGADFGEGDTLYVQYKVRYSPEVATWTATNTAGGIGFKMGILHNDDDSYGVPELTLSTDFGAEASGGLTKLKWYSDGGSRQVENDLGGGVYQKQQGDFEGCLYSAHLTSADCFYVTSYLDQWLTIYQKITIGTWDTADSHVETWIAPEGQPFLKVFDKSDMILGHTNGDYNYITLLPYMNGRADNGIPTHAQSYVWYDDLIVSTQAIESGLEDIPDPTCSDGIQNGNETGVDCGGSCNPCGGTVTPAVYGGAVYNIPAAP